MQSNSQSKISQLGFHHGRIKHNIANNKHRMNEQIRNTVFAAERVPWIKKNIFEIKEAKMSYFLIQQSLSSRKVDFMRLDTEWNLREHQLIIGNHYVAISLKDTH